MILQTFVFVTFWAIMKFSGDVLQKIQEAVMMVDIEKIIAIFTAIINNDYGKIVILLLVLTIVGVIFLKNKKKVMSVGAAHIVDRIVDFFFNYPLYYFVMDNAGLKDGSMIMFCLSFLICYIYIKIYDLLKIDLFLIEGAKDWINEKKIYSGNNKIKKLTAYALVRGGDFTAFLLLSFFKDPFYTVTYCRKGKYNGISNRDWFIFLGSVFLGNGYWAIVIFAATLGIDKFF